MKQRWLKRSMVLLTVLLLCFAMATMAYAAEDAIYSEYTVTSTEEFGEILRSRLAAREGYFKINYLSPLSPEEFDLRLLFDEDVYCQHTGVGNQGDYIKWHGVVFNAQAQYGAVDPETGLYLYTFKYDDIKAYTTAEQEAQVEAKIAALFEEWNIYDMPDYYKVRLIYDYICSTVSYDYESYLSGDLTLTKQYTAHAALIDGTAVCQGYANLFYRMANLAGVDTRLVTGMSYGEYHAWNLVCLDGTYYWLDSTWDAGKNAFGYAYFLLGSDAFERDHEAEGDWSAYPISKTDYECPAVESLQFEKTPVKQEYIQGDPLNTDGMALRATYSDGYTGPVFYGWYTSGYESGVVGAQLVAVHYDGAFANYLVTVSAGPEGWMYHGTWGDLTWTLTQEGKLTVSGQGPVKDSEEFAAPWRSYVKNITSLVIEDGVTKIGRRAFYNLYRLTSVTMADSVTKINELAFYASYALTDVQLSNGLVQIGEDAFGECSSLTQITLPDRVERLDNDVFYNCTALADIRVGPNIKRLGTGVFSGTAYYQDPANRVNGALYLGPYLLSVSSNAVGEHFVVQEGTLLIAGGAFGNCADMQMLTLPGSVKYIAAGGFRNCSGLLRVYYDGSSADWRQIEIGYGNESFLMAEFVFGNMVYDFTISTDETLLLKDLREVGQKFEIADPAIAKEEVRYIENVGFQPVLQPLRPGAVLLNVVDNNGIRVSMYTVLIQEGAHKMELVDLLLPATCTQPGLEYYVCAFCEHEELVETELAEHTWVYDPPVKETCETDGLTYGFHCSVCQHKDPAQQVIPAPGHDYGGLVLVHKPTVTGPAEYRRDCRNCDAFETQQRFVAEVWIMSQPDQREYLEGEAFDPTGLEVWVHYEDGELQEVTEYAISGYDNTPGTKTITVTCGGKSSTFTVYVSTKHVDRFEITSLPNKLTYLEGESFNTAGMVVTAYYNNGTSETVTDYIVSGYDSAPGTKTITVSYGGKSATFTVTVTAKSLQSISVTTKPNKLAYLEGESFDAAGMVVTAYYNNGTSEIVTDYTVSGYDSTPGTKTVTVSYGGKSATFTVTVTAKSLQSIAVTTKPNKLTYLEGESFNAAGMVVTAYYNNGTSETVTDYTVSGYDSTPGAKTIAVSYGGKSATFTVTVTAKSLQSIAVTTKPGKLTYLEGESFNPAGMVVTAYYNNGTSETVTDYTVSGYDSTPGKKIIIVSCGGKTATFNVTVEATPVEDEEDAVVDGVFRIYGSNRFDTAFGAANMLKETLGVEKFENIIVACGTNFADALAGSYLGKVKNAPILLVQPNMVPAVRAYIESNLQPGGTVYLLGGETIVPGGVSEGLTQFTTKRLWGANRYETNLAILEEAGVTGGEILVCTGYGFADSLSASAVGKPILLVDKKLTAGQEAYLASLTDDSYVIVGGIGAVNEVVEESLHGYGAIERLAGANRFATSVMVAERFFENPTNAVVAYAANFPDGLCGGPLAMSMGGPLLLTANNDAAITAAYTAENGIRDGVVLGGPGLISDAAVRQIFGMEADSIIAVK